MALLGNSWTDTLQRMKSVSANRWSFLEEAESADRRGSWVALWEQWCSCCPGNSVAAFGLHLERRYQAAHRPTDSSSHSLPACSLPLLPAHFPCRLLTSPAACSLPLRPKGCN